jgi:hypothetical protein
MFRMMAHMTVRCKCTRYDAYHYSQALTRITVGSGSRSEAAGSARQSRPIAAIRSPAGTPGFLASGRRELCAQLLRPPRPSSCALQRAVIGADR